MARKEYDYLVVLKTNTVAIINLISLLMLIVAILLFSYIGIRLMPSFPGEAWKPLVVAAFIFIWIIIRYLTINKPYFRWALLVAGVYFLFSHFSFYWIGFLYIIAGLLEKPAKLPQELGFDTTGITINSLIPKEISWEELTNVLIKDNLLTIDFKNNKLYQKEISTPVPKETEKEFNTFCQKHLNIPN